MILIAPHCSQLPLAAPLIAPDCPKLLLITPDCPGALQAEAELVELEARAAVAALTEESENGIPSDPAAADAQAEALAARVEELRRKEEAGELTEAERLELQGSQVRPSYSHPRAPVVYHSTDLASHASGSNHTWAPPANPEPPVHTAETAHRRQRLVPLAA